MAVTDARFEEREEDVPLLNANGDDEDTPLLRAEHQPPPHHHLIHETHSLKIIIAILFVIVFTVMAGDYLLAVPTMRVYEQIICQRYYNELEGERHVTLGGRVDEAMCKGEAVQKELNIVIAGAKLIGAVPALLLTVPYGLMMDRLGRKPVLMLSLFGALMACLWNLMVMWFWRVIPLRVVWIAPFFSIIGGGEAVAGMAVHTIAADVTTESNRSNVFFISRCAGLLAELIMPSVASALMTKSPWIPLLLGAGTVLFGTALVPFIPETLHLRAHTTSTGDVTPDSLSECSIKLDDSTFYTATKSQILDAVRRLAGSASIIRSPRIALLLMTFIVAPFSNQSVDLSVRYVSNRFNWTLASAGYLISLRALVNIILFIGILPSLSHFFTTRLNKTAYHKDLLLAKFSILVLVVGAFVIAGSNTIGLTVVGLMIWTLGTGFVSLIRALITALVDQEHIGRLNSVVAIVESGGELIAGPLLATVYTIGLELQGAWVGLPFFLLSGVCLIGIVGIWTFGFVGRREGEKGVGYGFEEEVERGRDNAVLVEVDRAEYGVINVL